MKPDIIYYSKNAAPAIFLIKKQNKEKNYYLKKNNKKLKSIEFPIKNPPAKKQNTALTYCGMLNLGSCMLKNKVMGFLFKKIFELFYKPKFKKIKFFQKTKIEKNKNGGL